MNRSLFQILGVVTMLGVVVPVFGWGSRQSIADTAGLNALQPNTAVPTGLTTAEWQQIENQLPVGLQEVKLTAGDAQIRDYFGKVAISGDTVVVAATGEDGGPGDPLPNAGAAYVFERNLGGTGAWGQAARLTSDDLQEWDRFGVSVAISGDTIVIGAWYENGGPGDPLPLAGAVYVFERNQGGAGVWGQTAKLVSDDLQEDDHFGEAVAISGDTIVVTSKFENGGPGDPLPLTGAAYFFERNLGGPGNWGQAAKVLTDDARAYHYFGISVAISGDTAVVGSLEGSPLAGAAYVFERNLGGVGNWGQAAKLIADETSDDDFFSQSVAVSGDIIVVGAYQEDGGPGDPLPNVGAAYVFERNQTGAWGQAVKLMAGDGQPYDLFGGSVAISGESVLVGAVWEDGGPGNPVPETGGAYVFERNQGGNGVWGQTAKLTAGDAQEDDRFGGSVAISGETIVVGAALH